MDIDGKFSITGGERVKPTSVVLIHSWEGLGDQFYITPFVSPPLGVHRLAKWARSKLGDTVDIHIIDPNLYDPREALSKIREEVGERNPDIVGFSPLHLTLENDIATMLAAQEASPDSLFIAGGRQTAFHPETLFNSFDGLHTIVRGEGENVFVQLLQTARQYGVGAINDNPAYFANIPGLFVRGKPATTIRDTGRNRGLNVAEFKEATWMMDFKDMDLEKYWARLEAGCTPTELADPNWQAKIYTLKPITTNYCPMGCSFCDVTSLQRGETGADMTVMGLRGTELEAYMTMLLETHPKVRQIMFKDDLFFLRGRGRVRGTTTSPLMLEDLAALKKVRDRFREIDGREITYTGKARVDTFIDIHNLEVNKKLLRATKEAGFSSISMGIESFDLLQLDHYNKRLGSNGPEVNRTAVRSLTRFGIGSVGYFILASDISTVPMLLTTTDSIVDLLEESSGHVMQVNNFLIPLPGTELTSRLHAEGASDAYITKSYSVPGYPNRSINRVYQVLPRDPSARKLMVEYDSTQDEAEKIVREELGVNHWPAEYRTPANLRHFYETGKRLGVIEGSYADHQIARLNQILQRAKSTKVEERASLTSA